MGSGAILLIADTGGKAAVAAGVTADLTDTGVGRRSGPRGGRSSAARAAAAVPISRRAAARTSPTPRGHRRRRSHTEGRLTMPGAYWIAHVTVTDEESLWQIRKPRTEAIAGAWRPVPRPRRAGHPEGGRAHPRNVVARFPEPRGRECLLRKRTYQEALSHARGASERDLVLVEALD
jgi:uncharacterized protein (DUF1330 family)